MAKYLDSNGLLYFWTRLKAIFIAQEAGKGLSANDYTDADKAKLDGLKMPLDDLTASDVDAPLSANQGRVLKGLVDDIESAGYQTAAQVETAIGEAIGDVSGLKYEVVDALPQTGEKGTIYLVPNASGGSSLYDEYIFVGGAFELIGTTAMDLSHYLTKDDVVPITNAEIDSLLAS